MRARLDGCSREYIEFIHFEGQYSFHNKSKPPFVSSSRPDHAEMLLHTLSARKTDKNANGPIVVHMVTPDTRDGRTKESSRETAQPILSTEESYPARQRTSLVSRCQRTTMDIHGYHPSPPSGCPREAPRM